MKVVVHRQALRGLLAHTAQVAKASKLEALGWLLGFAAEDALYVADTAPCTRYRSQSLYGAEADPAEEAALAMRYPRAVGIVGLYHSHPFAAHADHARFHSHTDDATLRLRASRAGTSLSVVTDTKEATFFALRKGRSEEIRPDVVEQLPVPDHLAARAVEVAPHFLLEEAPASLPAIVAALEAELWRRIDEALGNADVRPGRAPLPGLTGGRTNMVRVSRDGGVRAALELAVTPTVYLPKGADALPALREEIHDDTAFLLRQAVNGNELGSSRLFEAHLGTLRVQEHRRLPVKVYRPAKRSIVRRA